MRLMRTPSNPSPGRTARRPLNRTFRSLRNPNYRLYWIGQVISMLGTWMQTIGQAWLVLRLTDSPLALGVVTACQTLPVLVFGLFGGVIADRVPKRRLLVITQTMMLVQASALALLTAGGWINLAALYLLAAVLGTATALDNPTRQSFVKEMVGPDDVPNAIALNSIVMNTARLAGPALAGLTIAAVGVTACFALNAASFVAVIVALLRMRPERFFEAPAPQRGKVLVQIGEGLRYAVRTPEIAPILLLTVTFGIFGYNFNIILPLLARYVLHAGPIGFGALSSAMAVGSLFGAFRIAYSGGASRRMLLGGAAGFSIMLLCLSLSTRWLMMIPALAMLGACSITYFTTSTSRAQMIVPPELRGRVMSLYSFLDLGSAPIGSLLLGTLARQFGVRPTVGAFAVACGLGTLAGFFYLRHQHARPARSIPQEVMPPA
ncbi:MAG: MFS transporter [Chloroflexota bacterium]|nr:MFS transporter [Chloroflexota bacterium]